MALVAQIFFWVSLTLIGVQCQSCKFWNPIFFSNYLNSSVYNVAKETNLIVTTVLEMPYTALRESSESNLTGNDRFEGYIVDLIDTISKKLSNYYVHISALIALTAINNTDLQYRFQLYIENKSFWHVRFTRQIGQMEWNDRRNNRWSGTYCSRFDINHRKTVTLNLPP